MDTIKMVMVGVAKGMKDSVCGISTVFYLDQAQSEQLSKLSKCDPSEMSTLAKRRAAYINTRPRRDDEPKVSHRLVQCCVLNGGVFWLSIVAFYWFFLPSLRVLLDLIFGSSSELSSLIWSYMMPLLTYTFSALWVLPLFVLSKIVNSLWFQDIADSAYRYSSGRPQLFPSISKLIADTLFSIIVQALFLVQSMIVGFLPIAAVGQFISLVHMCLLYSLYAFEYKWFNMGWALHRRLSFIENNWPYFVGFGLPLALLTSLPNSHVISGCVFSILFPLFIISGNEAVPVIDTCEYPLRLFSPVIYVSNVVFNRTIRTANPVAESHGDIHSPSSQGSYRTDSVKSGSSRRHVR